jgi:hypothetical protein
LHERVEARVATEIVKHRIDVNGIDIVPGAFAVRDRPLPEAVTQRAAYGRLSDTWASLMQISNAVGYAIV